MSKKIAIWTQDFKMLISRGAFYLDKTKQLFKLVNWETRHYYFSRPRRFWKSLMLSVMKSVFLWEKELFKWLFINDKWNWVEENTYPVILVDFAWFTWWDISEVSSYILKNAKVFLPWEKIEERNFSYYFKEGEFPDITDIINSLYKETWKQVVMLVDEYDKPILTNLTNPEKAEEIRDYFARFYWPIKPNDSKIRFFFLSGLTKVMKMSIFSVLNNLSDISFKWHFTDVIWYTQEELEDNFEEELEKIAWELNLKLDDLIERLKIEYNGFNFGRNKLTLYNPWDINNFILNKEFAYYWADTGIPSAIKEYIEINWIDIRQLIEDVRNWELIVTWLDLKLVDLNNINIAVLFFNAWYLTIKEQDTMWNMFFLKFPNNETEQVMLSYFLNLQNRKINLALFLKISKQFIFWVFSWDKEEIQKSLERFLKEFLVDIPWEWLNNNPEWWLKSMIWLLIKMQNIKWWWEIEWLKQRSDLFIPINDKYIAIVEAKVNKTTKEAIKQIEEKYEPLARAKWYEKVMKIWVNWNKKWKKNEFEFEIEVY